jgi:AraC-like DNA-binding protein
MAVIIQSAITPDRIAAIRALLADASRSATRDAGFTVERIGEAMRLLSPQPAEAPVQRGILTARQIRILERHVAAGLADDLRVPNLARLVQLSPGYFGHAFRAAFGCSPHAYVTRVRLAAAEARMLDTDEPLARIALECGFCDQAHFSRVFRQARGTTPLAWRRDRLIARAMS